MDIAEVTVDPFYDTITRYDANGNAEDFDGKNWHPYPPLDWLAEAPVPPPDAPAPAEAPVPPP